MENNLDLSNNILTDLSNFSGDGRASRQSTRDSKKYTVKDNKEENVFKYDRTAFLMTPIRNIAGGTVVYGVPVNLQIKDNSGNIITKQFLKINGYSNIYMTMNSVV